MNLLFNRKVKVKRLKRWPRISYFKDFMTMGKVNPNKAQPLGNDVDDDDFPCVCLLH